MLIIELIFNSFKKGTESKSETEALLRKAMDTYESTQFVAQAKNITLAEILDMWIEDEVKPSNRSNGTLRTYSTTVGYISKQPLGKRKLQSIKTEHLQKFFDDLSANASHSQSCGCASVLRGAFRFAVFPKQLITFNPMQYVNIRTPFRIVKDTVCKICPF